MASISLRSVLREIYDFNGTSVALARWYPVITGPIPSVRAHIMNFPPAEIDAYVPCDNWSPFDLGNDIQDYFQLWCRVWVHIDLDFDSDTPLAQQDALKALWKFCIETWWSNRWAAKHGDNLPCPIKFQVVWGDAYGDEEVDVEFGADRSDYGEWFVDKTVFLDKAFDSGDGIKACMGIVHEFGHYIGLQDEYHDTFTCEAASFRALVDANKPSIMQFIDKVNPPVPKWHMQAFADNLGCEVVAIPSNLPSFDLAQFEKQRAVLFKAVGLAFS